MARLRSLEPRLQHDPELRNAVDETRRRPYPWLTQQKLTCVLHPQVDTAAGSGAARSEATTTAAPEGH
eukprot:7086356-Pyramimonas_sp.AAC.1